MFHGLGVIVRSPLLRGLVLLGMALAIVLAATQGMVIPFHFAFQDEPQFVGFVLSALTAGLLVGGGSFAALGHRIPHRVWFITGLVLVAAGFSVIGVLGPVWSIFAGAVIVGLGGGSMNAVIGLAFIENVDDSQRGTVFTIAIKSPFADSFPTHIRILINGNLRKLPSRPPRELEGLPPGQCCRLRYPRCDNDRDPFRSRVV
ncbi:hypothetical protein ABZ234_29535 [Nocardiopsis sp. NPDC006198]|uniref:hypothetical protein n=1 Tax=Nocardiopsis sp. NPDC006198 TaxID=3154472 RepID=UPI0033A60EEF